MRMLILVALGTVLTVCIWLPAITDATQDNERSIQQTTATAPTAAQFVQQGPKLVGTGSIGTPQQGSAVSISGDGNTAIIGGYGDNGNIGAAWVWTRSGGVWTQQSKLIASDAVGNAEQG